MEEKVLQFVKEHPGYGVRDFFGIKADKSTIIEWLYNLERKGKVVCSHIRDFANMELRTLWYVV